MKFLVVGNGAWGQALAGHVARLGHETWVWARSLGAMPTGCRAVDTGAGVPYDAVILATPAQTTRSVTCDLADLLRLAPLIVTAKGIEQGTLTLQSEVVAQTCPANPVAVLTGPSFAADVTAGKPTALTLACRDAALGADLQQAMSGNGIRLYLSHDLIGAQIGGALKNVIALACGMAVGRGLGASAQAALMTRGFAELRRLGLAMGAAEQTLAGLSGLGDLTLTCHSALSRNFHFGQTLAATGAPPPRGTFEGVNTAQAALDLAARHGADMPITQAVADILAGRVPVEAAMHSLLARPLRGEG